MKGIIRRAGGSGTRLCPLTRAASNSWCRFMINQWFILCQQCWLGLRVADHLTPDLPPFKDLLLDGSNLNQAFLCPGQPNQMDLLRLFWWWRIYRATIVLLWSWAIISIMGLVWAKCFKRQLRKRRDWLCLATKWRIQKHSGVVEFITDMNAISIEENPENPRSNYAVTSHLWQWCYGDCQTDQTGASWKSQILTMLIWRGDLSVEVMGRGLPGWIQGRMRSLLEASPYRNGSKDAKMFRLPTWKVATNRMGLYQRRRCVLKLAQPLKNEYGQYLLRLIGEI